MKFRYIASQLDGRVIESEIDAKDTKEVLQFLSSRGLKPISIRILRSESGKGFFSGRKINIEDQIFISKYLALMLKLGTGLIQAINILIDDFDKKAVRSFLIEVKNNLEGGMPFYSVFAKYPKTFSQVYINLIKAGETSGNLDSVFENLTTSLTKEKGLKDSIKSALIYPVLLVVASLSILIFLVMYALPKISKVFEQGGFEPPLFSRIVFSVGLFFADYGFYIIGFFVLLFVFLFFLYKNSVIFKRFVYGVFDGIPVIKNLIHKIALQRFAAVLSSLIKAGIPLVNALEITADTVGNIALKDAILRISKEGLMKGVTVGEAFKKEPIFPRTVVNLIAVSEKTGHMEDVLATLADFYSSEVDNSLKSLVAFLEPAMLVMIGGIIGLIALSIIVPIYQLTTQF